MEGRAVQPSPRKQVVERYLDGFRRTDRDQILSCLTDDIVWTVFGMFRLQGKDAYAAEVVSEGFTGSPELEVVRMVEEGDVVMAELTGVAPREEGTPLQLAMAEVFVFRGDLICERRAFVIPLEEDDVR